MKVLQGGLFAAALGRTVEEQSVHKDLGNDIRITKETVSSYLFIYEPYTSVPNDSQIIFLN